MAAYKNWGKSFINKLSGAFSFLIYDFKKRKPFLLEIDLDKKPFFYSRVNNHFNFASEVKGLLALGVVAKENKKAWHNYLVKGIIDENENTLFSGVKQLLPGNCGVLNSRNELKYLGGII